MGMTVASRLSSELEIVLTVGVENAKIEHQMMALSQILSSRSADNLTAAKKMDDATKRRTTNQC